MKKISVIVPIYNVYKYLRKCLDSFLVQDFKDFEVLLINDGSPFNEQEIIDEYVLKYPHIFKGITKENGGYGSVLELGIKICESEYFIVCDPDDYLEKNALSYLYNLASKTGADITIGAKNLFYEDSEDRSYDKSYNDDFGIIPNEILINKDRKEYELFYFIEPSPHSKLYRVELVKNLKFPHKVSYSDNLLYFYSLNLSNKVIYSDMPLANYLINRVGNTRTDIKPKSVEDFILVFNWIFDIVENANNIFYFRMFIAFYSIFYRIDLIKDDDIKKDLYEKLYTFLNKLSSYQDIILIYNKKYFNDTNRIIKEKTAILKNYINYQKLYFNRIKYKGLSFKHRLRLKICQNKFLNKIYEIYHHNIKYLITRNNEKIWLNKNVEMKIINDTGVNFFGYYDKPAVRNNHTIYHFSHKDDFNLQKEIDIYLNLEKISSSNTFNFQQGSMLSFLNDNEIIHNFYDGKYKSKIINLLTREVRVIDFPIYSVAKNGKFALSLDFNRLRVLRKDYGYFNIKNKISKTSDNEGIYYVDLIENKTKLLVSLNEIKNFETKESMNEAYHKVNHLDISFDSKTAIFLHRWYDKNNKYTRLMLLDIDSKKLKVLSDDHMVSHMSYYKNDVLFGYLRHQGEEGYYFLDFNGNFKKFSNPFLVDDGHPTIYNERYIVVDSYPNHQCLSVLYLIDLKLNKVIEIGKFYSYYKYQNSYRCDLHPRFNHNDKKITIDTVYNSKRRIVEIDLSKIIET